jgi:hypothetical protein
MSRLTSNLSGVTYVLNSDTLAPTTNAFWRTLLDGLLLPVPPRQAGA